MVQLSSPAPYASATPGLAFGVTNVAPYSEERPHQGKDRKWSIARPSKSKQIHASAAGIIKAAHDDGQFRQGWGNHIDLHITTEAFTRLAHHKTGSTLVRPGQIVALGARLATMGDTGETIGVHSHEELWLKQRDGSWKRVDPDLYRGPNGRHLPGKPLVSAPKPTPASPKPPKPLVPAPAPEEDDMNVTYHKPEKSTKVYALYADGTARHVGKVEWALVRAAHKVTGRKLPYTIGAVTEAQIATLPKHGK